MTTNSAPLRSPFDAFLTDDPDATYEALRRRQPMGALVTCETVADAVEIAQTCTLAGRADLIAGFLEAQVAPATVRSRLLVAQAEASPEIVSRIADLGPDYIRPVPR